MNNLFKLWKKGIAYEIVMSLLGYVFLLMGFSLAGYSLREGLVTASILIILITLIGLPILKGFVIEWLNNKTDVVNKFINK